MTNHAELLARADRVSTAELQAQYSAPPRQLPTSGVTRQARTVTKTMGDESTFDVTSSSVVSGPRFPDASKLSLDELLHQLMDHAQEVLDGQGRLRALLAANRVIVEGLALPLLLRRIVEAACTLARAEYGALGILDPQGRMEEFIHVGMSDEVVARIGGLPEGHGLLAAPSDELQPLRIEHIGMDARAVGFPPGHPPMESFLRVPIRIRDEVFGSLYLANRAGGSFTEEDEELIVAVAATAAVAIDNARLYGEAQRRQAWLQASTEVTGQILSDTGLEPLPLIARLTRDLAQADVVSIVLPDVLPELLHIVAIDGLPANAVVARTYPRAGSLVELALGDGKPVLIANATADPRFLHLAEALTIGPVMVLPMGDSHRVRGALIVARKLGRHGYTEADLEMATTFTNQAAVALELADVRADHQHLALLEDRDRIARDLHDHVIQRLFALGLTVQSITVAPYDQRDNQRLDQVVTELDETIRQIRSSIFELRGPLGPELSTVRSNVLALAVDVTPLLGFSPHVVFSGPVDALVSPSAEGDVLAVIREALTNVARHARAEHVTVDLSATSTTVTLDVTDDGVGVGTSTRRSGLGNLRKRAAGHGGDLVIGNDPDRTQIPRRPGTQLRWTIPVAESA